jgi:GxxExxY protein
MARENDVKVEKTFKEVLMSKLLYHSLSNQVLQAAFAVHSALGPGLLESAYESAFAVELNHLSVPFERQRVFPLVCRGEYVGAYIADLVADATVIIELKSVSKLSEVMEAQCINYLKLSRLPVGYLMNFHNTSLEWKRFVNQRGG